MQVIDLSSDDSDDEVQIAAFVPARSTSAKAYVPRLCFCCCHSTSSFTPTAPQSASSFLPPTWTTCQPLMFPPTDEVLVLQEELQLP